MPTQLTACSWANEKPVRLDMSEADRALLGISSGAGAVGEFDRVVERMLKQDRHPSSKCRDLARRFLCRRHIVGCAQSTQSTSCLAQRLHYDVLCASGRSFGWPISYTNDVYDRPCMCEPRPGAQMTHSKCLAD